MLLSLQIIAMLTWKEMPCVENLQITYCVNYHNTNIPGYCCQRRVFCDCYRNMGHILCSVERIKRFVKLKVHLHCMVSNIHCKVRKYSGPPELLRSEISFLRICNIPKQWKLHRKQGAFEWNKYFVLILIRMRISIKSSREMSISSPRCTCADAGDYLRSLLYATLLVGSVAVQC